MHAAPDTILSLDTEAEHGVRLSKCTEDHLEIELPASHVHHAEVGKILVGSSYVHGCTHLEGANFLHRISDVGDRVWHQDRAVHRIRLGAEQLASIAHAVPYVNFHFSYMPVEATDLSEYPEMVTDWGANRQHLKKSGRQLSMFDSMQNELGSMKNKFKNLDDIDGVEEDNGGFSSGGKTSTAFNTKNSFLNLQPKQVSNFGWNWNFYMNTTEANYEKNLPGLRGWMKLHNPYIRIHAGIYLNFTSEFTGLTAAPLVKWTAGVRGHGNVNAHVVASMNTTDDSGVDPFNVFKLPILEHLETPRWFNEVEFATGALPIKMEPGFQFKASMYHRGTFKGGISFGGKTHGVINPSLSYDSLQGFETQFAGDLIDTEITPPLWIIFTKQFELGLMGMPAILMRGDFAGMEKATMAIEGRPYMNITVVRSGANGTSLAAVGGASTSLKTLTAYPYRVSGISSVDFHTKYKVNVTANNKTLSSSPEINWGHVEFRDHVSAWDFGSIEQKTLMEQTFTVTLIEVNDASGYATESVKGTGTVVCTSLLNNECEPSPSTAVIKSSSGTTVASVDLAIVWDSSPEPWFASKIRGIGMSFPEVILRQDVLEQSFPDVAAPAGATTADSFKLHLIYAGKTYVTGMSGSITSSSSTLTGASVIDFGPTIIQNWMPCNTPCESPRLELYFGNTQVGAADLPQFDFSSSTAMQGTASGSFMGTSSSKEMTVPASVALYAPGSTTATVAVAKISMSVVMPLSSSIFLMPRVASQAVINSAQTFAWTVADVDTTADYAFTLTAYSLTAVGASEMMGYVNEARVNDKVLVVVEGSTKDVTQKCLGRATAGMSASVAPCSFETSLDLSSKQYNVGDQIVVVISWSAAGITHEMKSPPMEIVTAMTTAARRLAEDGAPDRRLWSADAWNARVQSLGAACEEKDLHFMVGAGMLVRGKVEQVSVPDGMPMIGGMMENPKLATQFKKIAGIKPGTDLLELLGGNDSILCQSGLCQGALPGCQQSGAKVMTFPKLVFDFNRPYHYGNKSSAAFGGMFRTALAYAFSTLPEAVDVLIKEAKEKAEAKRNGGAAAAPAPAPSSSPWGSVMGNNNYAQTTQAPRTTASPVEMNRWWGGESGLDRRRLTAVNLPEGVGSFEEMPSELQNNQVALKFKEGLPFVVDRKLLEMLQTTGHFKLHMEGLEDADYKTHGPLEIVNFYVDSGIPEGWSADSDSDSDVHPWAMGIQEGPAARGLPVVQGLGLAAFAGCCALLVASLMTKRSLRGARYAPTYETAEPLDGAPDGME
mmetsp:Transcript_37399/g.98922  ORF Transcript_37399/g.98922 Transcript_37399/m.98922 type:complete len:1281 (+) Transcript_37399:3-3845(+)